ncbi:iron ABC transporter permease [Winkia neuii]|nr:iron ABC transporter permease [Winkia neuii]
MPAGAEGERMRKSAGAQLAFLLLISAVVLLAIMGACLTVGRYGLPAHTIFTAFNPFAKDSVSAADATVLYQVRLPRMVGAALVGAALALAGVSYQGIFRNPLVSPGILGVSQGASVGAAGAILLGLSTLGVSAAALVGGIVAVLLATSIPRVLRNDSTLMLVLSGVIIGGFGSALVGILKFVADPETELAAIVFWQMGSLSDVRTDSLAHCALLALPAAALLLAMRWRINVISLGDREAAALGVNLRRDRSFAILAATVLTAAAVCLAGTVSWVGLVVPHLCRLVVGPNNARLLPLSVTFGASFMVVVDTLARSLNQMEVPLGVVTGMIGTPLFLLLLAVGKVKVR